MSMHHGMTTTVKLDPSLEESLRRRAAASGCTASDIIRAALVAYLEADPAPRERSAFELGADLFGRHGTSAAADLATRRKQHLAELWSQKRSQRAAR
jgi:hypothetical protein